VEKCAFANKKGISKAKSGIRIPESLRARAEFLTLRDPEYRKKAKNLNDLQSPKKSIGRGDISSERSRGAGRGEAGRKERGTSHGGLKGGESGPRNQPLLYTGVIGRKCQKMPQWKGERSTRGNRGNLNVTLHIKKRAPK